MMKKTFLLFVCMTLFTQNSFSSPKSTEVTPVVESSSDFRFGLSVLLGTRGDPNGGVGYGTTLSFDIPISAPELRLGIETGYFAFTTIWNGNLLDQVNYKTRVIPVAGLGVYRFDVDSKVLPFIEVAAGIDFVTISTDGNSGLFGARVPASSVSSTKLHLILKPGMEIGRKRLMFVQTPIGSMAGGFLFMLAFGVHLSP